MQMAWFYLISVRWHLSNDFLQFWQLYWLLEATKRGYSKYIPHETPAPSATSTTRSLNSFAPNEIIIERMNGAMIKQLPAVMRICAWLRPLSARNNARLGATVDKKLPFSRSVKRTGGDGSFFLVYLRFSRLHVCNVLPEPILFVASIIWRAGGGGAIVLHFRFWYANAGISPAQDVVLVCQGSLL